MATRKCRGPGRPTKTWNTWSSTFTGRLEGFNNKVKVAKRVGYGYRNEEYFFTLVRYLLIPSVRASSHRSRMFIAEEDDAILTLTDVGSW